MPKDKSTYVCAACGYQAPRWLGQCPDCSAWNTFEEQTMITAQAAGKTAEKAARFRMPASEAVPLHAVDDAKETRIPTGNEELDRVLGGGLVEGSVTLLGGDPGVGKSTLLLQVAAELSASRTVLYVSGEESVRQIKMRATRLGIKQKQLYVLAENGVESILEKCLTTGPDVLVIDSIQTMVSSESASAPGSVSQVRQSASAIIRHAKTTGLSVFLVGHVTKDGTLAGPRVLEHMVDTVLSFEGDRQHEYRLLRAVKKPFRQRQRAGCF